MKALFFIIFVCLANTFFAQVEMLATEITDIKQIKFKTYVLDVSAFNTETVDNMKNELIGWDDKIEEVILDESNFKLYITHNKLFNEIEFVDILSKYKMSKKIIIGYY